MTKESRHRLFFALWPDANTRSIFVKTFKNTPQYRLKGRITHPENLHLTLHFIGSANENALNCLDHAAKTVASDPFQLTFDRYGHFYKARIFWMGCTSIPKQLIDLHTQLGVALGDCQYTPDTRPYAPHLTLMRKVIKPGEYEDFSPINWQINDFVLVESTSTEQGVHYEVIQRYPLISGL